jgi:hypothetical protein
MSDWSDGVLSAPGATGGGNFMDMLNPSSALMKTGLSVLGSTLQAAPSSASARGGSMGGGMFDSSGMNTSFGSGDITSDRTQTPLPGLDGMASKVGQYIPYIVIGIVAWKIFTRKKS